MKKQLLIITIAVACISANVFAIVNDRTVHNNTEHVVFVAWKSGKTLGLIGGSKSLYDRLLPGESKTFGVTDRGYGMKGLYGNIIQVELGGKIGSGKKGAEEYRKDVNAKNKSMDKYKEAFIKPVGSDDFEVLTSGELAEK